MLTPGKIYVGTGLQFRIAFRDEDGDLADPTTVTFETCNPCGDRATYVYGTDDEITQVSTGIYTADIEPGRSGRWRYRWLTTEPAFAKEDDFLVQDSPFADDCGHCGDYA